MFLIIWQRWGHLGLAFLALGFGIWIGLGFALRAVLGNTQSWWNVAALIVGFGLGALANWVFAVKLVEPRLDRPQDDLNPPPPRSTLFFLPLRHWTWVILAIGVVFLIPNVLDNAIPNWP